MMQVAKIVSIHYILDNDYRVELDLNCGVIEVWLYRKDIAVKTMLFGVQFCDTSYEQVLEQAEAFIKENDCIEFYESEYVDV